jgi:preprotein translocase subunit SecD
VAPPRSQKSGTKAMSHPGRALAALLALIIIMVLIITGADAISPGKWHKDFKVALGLDLAGGTQVTLSATTLKGKNPSAADMTTAIGIMNSRVDAQGFNNAQVQQQGSNFITVTVPGKNAQQVVNLVGTTALLYFREVYLEGAPNAKAPTNTTTSGTSGKTGSAKSGSGKSYSAKRLTTSAKLLPASAKPSSSPSASSSSSPSSSPSPSTSPSPSATPPPTSDVSGDTSMVKPSVLALFYKLNCNDKNWKESIGYTTKQYDDTGAQIVSCAPAVKASNGIPASAAIKYVLGPAVVKGTDVTGAQAGLPNQTQSLNSSNWQVNLTFNGKGGKEFGDITSTMYTKYTSGYDKPTSVLDQLAVVLDGAVVSAPDIDEGAIPGGSAEINGSFTQAQATQLANELQYGALPINLQKQDVESVSASLGRDQLVAGLIAAAIGLGLVVVYSFLYYRGLGLVSVSSLIIAATLAYLCVVLLSKYASSGFNLSLAGIAGLIVAIGITADSFVVFFERLRDEVRDGRSLRPAVESGWRRARRTILVSDTVSFLCALLLWYFSVSDVKGFAFTLGLTTLIDVVVVFLFTKPMVTLLAKTKFFSSGRPLSGLDPKRLGARAPWRSGIQRTQRPASRVKEA